MSQTHLQLVIKDTNREQLIRIYTDRGWPYVQSQFATVDDVSSICGVSRATAYRIMQQLPRYAVEDYRDGERHYTMVKRSDLAAMQRKPAGNPHFADPSYQSQLAQRPRKKPIDK